MNTGTIVQASYRRTGISRFDGNPFIEALPPLPESKSAVLAALSNYPPIPTAKDRKKSEIVRSMEVSLLNDVVIPFPEYERAALSVATLIRERYVSCNPLHLKDRQRRYAIALKGEGNHPFPADWKSSARGHLIMSHSGMGKTTFCDAYLLGYAQLITHVEYRGKPLRCQQVAFLVLRVPHDATLKSLCLQFFEHIDGLLGTKYVRQARTVRHIAQMIQLMQKVAAAVSLGLLIIDEVQNLRSARGGAAEHMLNFFSDIIESLGISLLLLATPAVQSVIERSVRNGRKMTSMGETVLSPMRRKDPQWQVFCETYWDYSFVKNKGKLTPDLLDAWHESSGGNTAFASLAFHLAQADEIGGRETVDRASFERVSATRMAFLQPAISALRSGDPEELKQFDDLVFSPRYLALRKQLGALDRHEPRRKHEEFEDIADGGKRKRNPPSRRIIRKDLDEVEMDVEDPLAA